MTTRVNASRRGLAVIFLSSFLALSGAFMLLPLNILRLTQSPDAPLLAGLFGATSWLGIFALTPWASWLTHRWGRRASLLVAGWVPVHPAARHSTDSPFVTPHVAPETGCAENP